MSLPDRVIFLDCDGVMNSLWSFKNIGDSGPGRDFKANFLPEALAVLHKLIADGWKVCVSSSWRIIATEEELIQYLEIDPKDFLGTTPRWYDVRDVPERPEQNGPIRGDEIHQWFSDAIATGVIAYNARYVIIDDDSDMLPHQLNNFIHTKFWHEDLDADDPKQAEGCGLTWSHYDQIKQLELQWRSGSAPPW